MKKNQILILSTVSIFTINQATAEVLSWPCGSDCTLTFNTETKHAVVSGHGDMQTIEGYSPNKNAWGSYAPRLKALKLKPELPQSATELFQMSAHQILSFQIQLQKLEICLF